MMRPISECVHRLTIDGHLWCQHPRVSIAWASNFLDIDPTGKSREQPEFCRTCSLIDSQVDHPRVPPSNYIPVQRLSDDPGQQLASAIEIPGAGTELYKLLRSFNDGLSTCSLCLKTLIWMNKIGPAQCLDDLDEILRQLKVNQKFLTWWQLSKTAAGASLAGYRDLRGIVRYAILSATHETRCNQPTSTG